MRLKGMVVAVLSSAALVEAGRGGGCGGSTGCGLLAALGAGCGGGGDRGARLAGRFVCSRGFAVLAALAFLAPD